MFASSVTLFKSLPVNQKRSKFTGLCNKPVFMKLLKHVIINIVETCQSLLSFDLPIASSLRNVPKSLKTASDIILVKKCRNH